MKVSLRTLFFQELIKKIIRTKIMRQYRLEDK